MKIAIVCTLYPPYILGGAEKSTALLASGLASKGHNIYIITTGSKEEKEIVNSITIYRLKNQNIYWRYPQRDKPILKKAIWHFIDIYNLRYKKSIEKILAEIKPDIVHTGNLCGLSCIIWNIASKMKIPIVHTLRDYYLICPQQTMMKTYRSCKNQCTLCKSYSYLKKIMSQKVNAVVGISNFILKHHLKFGYFNKAIYTCIIPNSVEKTSFIKGGTSHKNIGYIGRLSPEKGVELMIEAFKESYSKGTKLLIAGTGNQKYVEKLKQQYENDNICFLGLCKSTDFFSNIDLLIVPSLWNEPFGRVVIEAYNSHIPVFMANNGGLSELYVEGVSKLFTTDSPSSLTYLLNKYYNGDIQFDYNKFDEIISHYSEEKITLDYINLYRRLCK